MSFSSYRRPVAPLPSISALLFPGNLVAQCRDCNLCKTAKRPVPGDGPMPAEVMLIGQNPGRQEDLEGKPFIGPAGQYLNSLLFQCGISREAVYITNLVKCVSPGNRVPTSIETKACAKWLSIELGIVQPHIIVAMGAPAIARFLGSAETVEHLHGKPVEVDGRIILPAYHPAAALRDTAKLRQCSDDFQVLRGLVKGHDWREYHIVDEYPNPVYQVADTDAKVQQMQDEIRESGEVAVDTEICRGKLWSIQFSAQPGTAWFVPIKDDFTGRVDLTGFGAIIIVHNYLFDVQHLIIPDNNFVDSMTQAYLLGLPQGLKELASRLCGIKMVNYREVVHPGQQSLAFNYLLKASEQKWPDPPTIEETKWDNRKGKLVTKAKKPWHISRKMSNLLGDFEKGQNTDLWDRWRSIPAEERAVVESVLGVMPESSLADILFEKAVDYSCRDSDSTLRVHHKLKQLIEDMELDFIQHLDLGVLPEVWEMMQNGMPVDIPYLKELSVYYGKGMVEAADRAAAKIGHSFNPSSSKQVATVVYGELHYTPTKHTATELICTDDQELKKVNHPVVKDILEYRRLLKNKSTFADALVDNAILHQQGAVIVHRVHTTLKTTRTETGRLSSADPINLQTIPIRTDEGKKIRKGFKASPGYKLLAGDFSQQELRLQAHEAGCKNMLDLFRNGIDIHTSTASRIFGVPMEEAEKTQYRYPSKILNFEIIYLVTAEGLCESIHEQAADILIDDVPMDVSQWTVDSCDKLITGWYKVNPEVKDWQMEKIAEARRYGYVRDILGRIRYVPEVSCPVSRIRQSGERMAVNFPIQGGCAGITKMAMLQAWKSRNKLYSPEDVRFLMAIHDELMLEVREGMVMEVAKWLKHIMDNVIMLDIPMLSEMKSGDSWGEMQKIKLEG